MTRREAAYTRKMGELIKRTGRLRDREVKKVFKLLESARKDVAGIVASTPWQAHHLAQAKEAVGRAVETFSLGYMAGQNEALANAFAAGIDLIDNPLQVAGIGILAPELSRTALEIAQGYSADLIGGLSADAVKKINAEIMTGVMGQKAPFEVMKSIGLGLDEKGVFSSLGHRAEAITRTEMASVQSQARQARMLAVADKGTEPQLEYQKKWISSGKAHPREHHAALDGMVVGVNEDFPGGIPYPHAPGLPASEVVNCGCTHVLWVPDWDELPTQYEPIQPVERAIYD